MPEKEGGLFVPQQPEFQQLISYNDVEKSPPLVVRQTNTLLSLFYQGAINNPGLAKDYLHDYTIKSYLEAAEAGSFSICDQEEQVLGDIDPEAIEAARHAFVIFGSMPDRAKGTFFTVEYARTRMGILKAPKTREEFLKRIKELKLTVWQVVDGYMEARSTLGLYPSFLRTFKFFEVGSELPIKLTPDKKEEGKIAREKFNDLLAGIDVSLSQ